jgi:hypothetical protein
MLTRSHQWREARQLRCSCPDGRKTLARRSFRRETPSPLSCPSSRRDGAQAGPGSRESGDRGAACPGGRRKSRHAHRRGSGPARAWRSALLPGGRVAFVMGDGGDRDSHAIGEVGDGVRESAHHLSVLAAPSWPAQRRRSDEGLDSVADGRLKDLAEPLALFFVPSDRVAEIRLARPEGARRGLPRSPPLAGRAPSPTPG